MIMHASAVIITVIGMISAVYTGVMNAYMPKTIKKKKKEEMIMFYWRFILDVIFAVFAAPFFAFSILYSLYPEQLQDFHNLIFYLALPASNVGAIRSIITLAITLERNAVAYFPIVHHNYRAGAPMFLILIAAVLFGCSEYVVLFGLCDFHLDLPYNCAALGCAVNPCFLRFWTTHKSVNRIALIDAGNVCIFDFLPSVLANQLSQTPFFSFQNLGPYTAVTKALGCACEAYLVFRTFSRRNKTKALDSSVVQRSKMKSGTTFPVT
uniref:Uncharacterized protein n=3 Tax=Caenorhabditis japonica TaxID=281687 RepID=A0A8R1HP32_CAEJA